MLLIFFTKYEYMKENKIIFNNYYNNIFNNCNFSKYKDNF